MCAGLAGLRLLTGAFYKSLNRKCDIFARDVNGYFIEKGVNAHVACYRSMMSIRFRKELVKNYRDALDAAGGERYGALFRHLLEAGIYWPPADLEAFFVSNMHTKQDLAHLAKTLKEFFEPS